MALILKNNVVYLHVPKTGGNWLTKLFKENGIVRKKIEHKHATYDLVCGALRSHYRLPFRDNKNHYEFMVVVRNPLLWLESWYKYQNSRGFRNWGKAKDYNRWHVMSQLNDIIESDFNEFVKRINRNYPGFVSVLYGRYIACSGAYVLKNESLRIDLERINEKLSLGIPTNLIRESPVYGASPKSEIVWDRNVFEETIQLEMPAIKKFNYAIEGVVNVN